MFAPPNGTGAGLAMQQRFGDVWCPVVTSVLAVKVNIGCMPVLASVVQKHAWGKLYVL
jgi:hypothetical protein